MTRFSPTYGLFSSGGSQNFISKSFFHCFLHNRKINGLILFVNSFFTYAAISGGRLDEISSQWDATDHRNEEAFRAWVKTCIDSGYDVPDEDGNLQEHFERLEHLGDRVDTLNLSKRKRLPGKLLWPPMCYDYADRYRGEETDKLNWKWINDNFSDPVRCVSMFHDPRTVSVPNDNLYFCSLS